jgi:hypothetical protein
LANRNSVPARRNLKRRTPNSTRPPAEKLAAALGKNVGYGMLAVAWPPPGSVWRAVAMEVKPMEPAESGDVRQPAQQNAAVAVKSGCSLFCT